MRNVFLTGFMGTGKTAVGRALARRLERRFVDLDEEIERTAGVEVAEIFARFGEREFRSRERDTLERLCALDGAVIATGGGVVVDPDNRAAMRACGTIVCLTADPAAILARVGSGRDRPLLADAQDPSKRVGELLEARAEAYADADLTIETSRTSAEEVSAAIAEWLLEAGTVDGSAKTARK
jgi:shikimate kinase